MNDLIVRFYVNEENKQFLTEIITNLNLKNKDSFELEIHKNDEFDYKKSQEFPDGFLYFINFLEYFKDEDKYLEEDIYNSRLILETLWENNIPSVAACDFEEELPEQGGYKSKNIPWVK